MESSQPPQGPQSPTPGPQSPAPGGYPPPPAPGVPPQPQQYGGPVPPGGWQQPIPQGGTPGGAQLASWGSRLGAWLIDGLIVMVPAIALLTILGAGVFAAGGDDGGFIAFVGGLILMIVVITVVALLYAPLLMMRQGPRNGQTIGKQLVDIRAVRDNGQPWTFGSAALREVVMKQLAVGIASSVIPILPWFLNYFWPLWDDQNRALHDMAVSSHVVKT